MRAKERAQNVGAGYSSGRKELPAREAGLVCAPESALPSWGCDRGWRAGAMLRSRSTQEMDGGENKVDEMKVARPPVFVNVHLGPSALVALLSRVALFGARNGWLRLGGATLSRTWKQTGGHWESPRAPLSAARRDVLSALRQRAHYSVRYVCASSGEAGRAQPTPRTPSPPRRARIPARRARQNRRLGAGSNCCLWLTPRGDSTGLVTRAERGNIHLPIRVRDLGEPV